MIEDLVRLGNKILDIKIYVVFRGNDYFLVCREIIFTDENGDIKTKREYNNPNYATFPLIKSIFPSVISSSLVSVQPLSGPTGSLFYLDYQYKI